MNRKHGRQLLIVALISASLRATSFAACRPVTGLTSDINPRLFNDPFGKLSWGACDELRHYIWSPTRPMASTDTESHPTDGKTFAGPANTPCGIDIEHGWTLTHWSPRGAGLRLNTALFMNDFFFDSCVCPSMIDTASCSRHRVAWVITNEASKRDEPLLVAAAQTIYDDVGQAFDWDLVQLAFAGECRLTTASQPISLTGPEVQVPRPEVTGTAASSVHLEWPAETTFGDAEGGSLISEYQVWYHTDRLVDGRLEGLPPGKTFTALGGGDPEKGWIRLARVSASKACLAGHCGGSIQIPSSTPAGEVWFALVPEFAGGPVPERIGAPCSKPLVIRPAAAAK